LNPPNNYLEIHQIASLLKVPIETIKMWIERGMLESKQINGTTYISSESYNKFTESNLSEIMIEVTNNLWVRTMEREPVIREEVNKKFQTNSILVLERAQSTVDLLQSIHSKYEQSIDIFESKHGGVAAFIIYSRIISMLHSIIELLKSTIFSEAYILMRPLWEAILLADYFFLSEVNSENKREIRRWFENEETPQPREIRRYLSEKINIPLELLNKQYKLYSKPIHHTYNSIMESYQMVQMSGFGQTHTKRYGFDYHKSTKMRDIITLITVFEGLLQPAIRIFIDCFVGIGFTDEEVSSLENEAKFYLLDSEERLNIIFNNR